MRLVRLQSEVDFDGWRRAARALIAEHIAPEDVEWAVGVTPSLLAVDALDIDTVEVVSFKVSAAFVALAKDALLHRDPARFGLLYRLLRRLQHERRLMSVASDTDVVSARSMAKAVSHEIHKIHAFVRFREITTDDGPAYIAWFEPEHHTLEAAAPFFVRRFSTMRWSILTPRVSAHWDLHRLDFAPGADRAAAPSSDAIETLWRTYYASIFNPARLKTQSMRAHMPRKYWKNLPESELIDTLVAQAPRATGTMIAQAPSTPRLRARVTVAADALDVVAAPDALREAARRCTRCPLHAAATQTVFGVGPAPADVMFVGEQPGDQEDLAGEPFVGPAGQLFDRALADVGIDRSAVYVTNAVKHFKFEPRGKRRLHKTPGQLEIEACRHWLEREIVLVAPRLVVALGATAAHSVLGQPTPVQRTRGRLIKVSEDTQVLVTVHPSYLLRLPEVQRAAEYSRFTADLRLVRDYTANRPTPERYISAL